MSLENAIAYAKQRKAFSKAIADFGLVREKLANMATLIYVGEALVYRTVGMMDVALNEVDKAGADAAKETRKAIEEYAVECSILKVWGSEMIDYVVDETVQIYGGYGFVEEYPAERAYRDARINRIFEGTNEINRLIITGFLLKRAMSGQLPLMPAIKKLMDEVLAGPSVGEELEGPLAEERKLVAQAKKLGLFAAGAATQKYMQAIQDQQEVMGAIADMVIETYAMESAVLRAQKMVAAERRSGSSAADRHDAGLSVAGHGEDRSGGEENHRSRGRGRHAADPAGHPAPPGEARAVQHHCTAAADRAEGDRAGQVHAGVTWSTTEDTEQHRGKDKIQVLTLCLGAAVCLRLLFQFFHHALDQFFRVGKSLHHQLDVEDRLARPALALAIDAVLADQRHGVGDHVHGHRQPSSRDAHHGFVVFQFFLLFVEYRHGLIVSGRLRGA